MDRNNSTGRAWVELSHGALLHNVAALRSLLPSGCVLMPAVKADAYGHGMAEIAGALQRAGVRAFCAATAQEGAALRGAGIAGEILILGYTHPTEFPLLTACDLTQSIVDADYGARLCSHDSPIKAHIAVDTGMHRSGIPWDDHAALFGLLRAAGPRITGIYTHLCADMDDDSGFTQLQAERFDALCRRLNDAGYHPKAHLLNSFGLLRFPQLGGSYARVGIALYGVLSTRGDLRHCPIELQPVLSLKARVALVRDLPRGESAGYGMAYTAPAHRRIAVLTIGYADGLPRGLSHGRGAVLLHGQAAPIIGRICMDQTLVDVTDIPNVTSGDAAVLIGKSGSREITAYDLAEAADTITNELLSRLGARLERVTVR